MIGAIIGDIVGSVFEHKPIKTTKFKLLNPGSRFTDDTVLTVAVADALLKERDYATSLREWGQKYPAAGYGESFDKWLFSEVAEPYNSWGNGAAMRVSPAGFAFNHLSEALEEAQAQASVTHNHPEGIKGARAVAAAIFMARSGNSKSEIRNYIELEYKYDLGRSIKEIRPDYSFDISSQGSVPEAIIAFLDSSDYESALRLAVSLGGDSDTLACISGSIAQAYYGEIPEKLKSTAREMLPEEMLRVIDAFEKEFLRGR